MNPMKIVIVGNKEDMEFLKKDNSFDSKTWGFGVWTMQVVIIAPWLKF
jgi:hypothetical protein